MSVAPVVEEGGLGRRLVLLCERELRRERKSGRDVLPPLQAYCRRT